MRIIIKAVIVKGEKHWTKSGWISGEGEGIDGQGNGVIKI